MSRWFRVHDEMLDDPKVQKLHPDLFKILINLWCVASRNDGRLPPIADLAFSLRMPEDVTLRAVTKLVTLNFIDPPDALGFYKPHAWDKRQFKSDSPNERVRLHRERKKIAKAAGVDVASGNVTGNVTKHDDVTAPESEADTEQNRRSVAGATGAAAPAAEPEAPKADEPVDLKAVLFQTGRQYLVRHGLTPANAGSMLGKWRQSYGDGAVIDALHAAQSEACSEPIAMITRILEARHGQRTTTGRGSGGAERPVSGRLAAALELASEFGTGATGDQPGHH